MANWSPESTDLLATTVTVTQFEEALARLWHEFLRGYFDGQNHGGIVYPAASFLVMQGRLPKMERLHIQIVSNLEGRLEHTRMQGTNWLLGRAQWTFLLRYKAAYPELCRRGADRMLGLLADPDRMLPMSRAGVYGVLANPAIQVQSSDYSVRRIIVRGRISMPVLPWITQAGDVNGPILDANGVPIFTADGQPILAAG
jgi:hypothetical protein